MKQKILVLAAMASVCLLGACSDDASADPTRGELCQGGLSFDCLADGTWQMDGATEITDFSGDTLRTISKDHNFATSPASIVFGGNGKFTFTYPAQSAMQATCYETGGKTYGSWSVSGKKLILKTNNGNVCFSSKSYEKEVSIRKTGAQIELDLNGIFFLNSEMENAGDDEKATTTEVFHISAQ